MTVLRLRYAQIVTSLRQNLCKRLRDQNLVTRICWPIIFTLYNIESIVHLVKRFIFRLLNLPSYNLSFVIQILFSLLFAHSDEIILHRFELIPNVFSQFDFEVLIHLLPLDRTLSSHCLISELDGASFSIHLVRFLKHVIIHPFFGLLKWFSHVRSVPLNTLLNQSLTLVLTNVDPSALDVRH